MNRVKPYLKVESTVSNSRLKLHFELTVSGKVDLMPPLSYNKGSCAP